MEKNELPIAAFREKIVKAVEDNSVVLITAETGAGKSTQVPQYLYDEGYNLVVTQPRRLAARTVAARVADERGEELGHHFGFRTAYERQDSKETCVLFCTDGLALVRELVGAGGHDILVIDEVHEWNLNIEVLVAWAKRQIEEDANFKVVVMSATLEAEKLSKFFGGVPVVTVPGRLYPVTEEKPRISLEDHAAELLRQGRNVLVFQPGKKEIGETLLKLKEMGVSAELLPLHGELDVSEQAKVFKHYGRPKCIVSTNVAQTSVTIDDIDAVVDSGMERRVELVDGVEGLYLKPISRADREQRKGRAGRTKPGIYIDWCSDGWSDRLEFPKAEILRTRLDQTVLRLAEAGFDAEELSFFHQPPREQIHEAKRALRALGCMKEDGTVTAIGRQVAKLPVSVQFGRMIIEAERLVVVDDVITVAAILEQGEIHARACAPHRAQEENSCRCWRKLTPEEKESDVLAELAVYKAAEKMSKDEMAKGGVFLKAFFQAKEKRRHLADALRGKIRFGSNGKRENILRAVCAGMVDNLYKGKYGLYHDTSELGAEERILNRESMIISAPEWLVGFPWDLQIQTRRGPRVLRLIRMASKVDPAWLMEIAPQLSRTETHLDLRYDPKMDSVVSATRTFFGDLVVREEWVPDEAHPGASAAFAQWLAAEQYRVAGMGTGVAAIDVVLRANDALLKRMTQLNIRTGEKTFQIFSPDEIAAWFTVVLSGAKRTHEVVRPEALALPGLEQEKADRVIRDNPDTIELMGRIFAVEYRMPWFGGEVLFPRVRILGDSIPVARWNDLPDGGVFLPGGRAVEVAVEFGYFTCFTGTDICKLKQTVRERLNLREGFGRREAENGRYRDPVPAPAPKPSPVPESKESVDLSKIDLSKLFGGNASIKK